MRVPLAIWLSLGMAVPAFAQSVAPRDTPPPVIENARHERELRAVIASGAATKETYTELASLMMRLGKPFDAAEALRGAAALDPGSAEAHHRVAVLLWDGLRQSTGLDDESKRGYILQGIAAEDRALAAQPDYLEALTYKNILLRIQANLTSDRIEQKRLIDEADVLRNRVLEMQRLRQGSSAPPAPGAPRPPTPPAPPFAGFSEPFDQTMARVQPVRVGGNVRTPTKVRDVKPAYPAEAQASRVQGVVILEALVDERGDVVNARVLRSIPLLDEAALGAVSQWQFTPTLLNGLPVGVVMTVTVNFTLQQP